MADRTVTYRFVGNVAGLQASMSAASTSVKGFGTNLTALDAQGAKMRAGLTTLGASAGRMGLVAAAGLALTAKAAMDWEVAWTGVLKTVDGTPAQLSRLEDGLRGLAVETGFAASEVASVAEAAGQLGISTGGVETFTRTMLDMGVATNLSANEAATGFARLRNIMGTSEAEIRNTGSAIVDLGNNFATTESEILAMSLRISGAGRQAGLTTSEVLALSTAMSSVGIEAEAGGTAMSLTMKRIGKSVDEGGESLALFAETSGMTQEQFSQSWGTDAAGTLQQFVAGLGRVQESGGSVNAVLTELGIKGIREADALLRLSGNAEGLADALGVSSAAFEENNALAEEAGQFYGTSAQRMKQAMAQIKDTAIDMGGVLLPIISEAAEGVGKLAEEFGKLPNPVKNAVTGMLGITAILGGGLWFASKTISGITATRVAMVDLGLASKATGTAMTGMQKATMAARGAAGLAGMAILSTEVADKFALANTAAYALIGTMVGGPWGAAIGGSIGLIKDLAGANNEAEASTKRLDAAFNDMSGLAKLPTIAKEAIDGIAGMREEIEGTFGAGGGEVLDAAMAGITERFEGVREAAVALGADASKINLDDLAASGKELGRVFADATPAMEALGISMADLQGASDVDLQELVRQIGEWNAHADSSVGKTEAVGAAFGELDNEMVSVADSAKVVKDALSALLDPAMDQERALLALRDGLRNMKDELDETSRSLDGNTDAGQKNREAILDRIGELKSSTEADAANNASQAELTKKLKDGREALLDSAEANGLNRGAVEDLVDAMNLTPEGIETIVEVLGTEAAQTKVKGVKTSLWSLAKEIASPSVVLNGADQARSALGELGRLMNGLDGKKATMTTYKDVITRRSDIRVGSSLGDFMGGRGADGTTVPGQRAPYGDKVLMYLAPGEEVISNRDGQADRNRHLLKAINSNRMADGGTVGVQALASGGTVRASLDERRDILRLEQSIIELTRSINAKGKDALSGRDLAIAEVDRQIARSDLRGARMEPFRRGRQSIADRRSDTLDGLSALGTQRLALLRPDGIVGETDVALRAFKRSIEDAGGRWSNRARAMAAGMMDNARAVRRNEAALSNETEKRDLLNEELAEHKSSLNELRQTMDQLSSQVASNFLSNPFNATVTGGPSAELLSAQDALSAAKGRYSTALSSGGDAVQRAYQSSRALAEVDQYQAQVDSLASVAVGAVSGLAAFDQAIAENTAAATEFHTTLTALAKAGLDGPLFEMLAGSGDTGLARELLASGAGGIDARERAYADRDRITSELGAMVATEMYGAQYAEQAAAYQRHESLLASSDGRLATMLVQQATNDARRDQLVQEQTAVLSKEIRGLQATVAHQNRQLQTVSQQMVTTKKGRK